MAHNANIYSNSGSLHIEIAAGYGDAIELRTAADWLELLRDLIAAGNAHFDMTAQLMVADPPHNTEPATESYTWDDFRKEYMGQFEAMVAALQPVNKAPHTRAEHQAANQQALDDIAAFVGGTR